MTKRTSKQTSFIAALALAAGVPAHAGLSFNTTFDSSVTSLTDHASVESAFNYATAQFQSFFSDNITINIDVVATTDSSVFGQSSSALVGAGVGGSAGTYTDVRNALISHATTADDSTATGVGGSVGNSDPTGSAAFWVTRAEGKALGIVTTPNDSVNDGTFTFNSTETWNFNTGTSRNVTGSQYDFVGVCEHEISEIMGRISGLGASIGGGPAYLPYDLFRFTSAGTRGLSNGSGIYFSINNGTLNLRNYNFPNGNGSDPQDWASGQGADAANAATGPGVQNDFTAVDKQVMDVIGYTPVPEPATTGAIAAGFLAAATAAQRRFRRQVGT